MRGRIKYCEILLLAVAQIAIACTIVEVEVQPKKVNSNVIVVALKDEKPLVGVPIVIDRLEGGKTMKSALQIVQVMTNARGEVALRALNPGVYALSVSEKEHKHWLGSIEVSNRSDADVPRVEFNLLPEAPPPPRAPAPILVQRLTGELHDPSGAVFANTKFKINKLDRRDELTEIESNTNGRGEFSLAVPDGNYELRVAVRGFNPAFVPLEVSANSERGWKGIDLTLELAKCAPGMNPYLYSIADLKAKN